MDMMRSDFGELQLDAKLIDSSKVIDGYIYLSEELVDQKLLEKQKQKRLNYWFVLLLISAVFFVWYHQLLPVRNVTLESYHQAPALGEMLSDTLIEGNSTVVGVAAFDRSIERSQVIPDDIARFIDADLSIEKVVLDPSKITLEEVLPPTSGAVNIEKILASGNSLFKRDRLMSPPEHNAFARYEKVLSIDPTHKEALKGIRNIVDRYVYFAESVIAKNESYKVPVLVKRAYQAGEKYMDVSVIIQQFSSYLSDDSIFFEEEVREVVSLDVAESQEYDRDDAIFIADQKVAAAALSLYQGKRIESAEKMLHNFTRLSGFWGASNDLLLKIYLSATHYAKAENLIYESKALDTHQFTDKAARIIMARGDNQGALNMLMAHRPEFLANKDYYTLLASLHYKVGNFTRSVYWYRQLLSIDHQNARLWLGLAVSLDNLNQADDALQAFSYVRLYASNQPIIKHYINERQLALADY
jgi:tetratricopeptide (TPR) repeat protein